MYDNLQEKYKKTVFQILKYAKRLVILISVRRLGKITLGCAIVWKYDHRKFFVN